MKTIAHYAVFVTSLLLAIFLFGCTASRSPRSSEPDIQSQLDALQAPQGVDPQVFAQLKDAFAQAMQERGKAALRAPSGAANAPANVHFTDEGGGNYMLHWEYRNIGDYDQDGKVGISDITPLAVHFGHSGADGLDAVIDGNGNGTIGIEDITPIAQNFGVEVAHYQVDSSTTETGIYNIYVMSPFSDGAGGADGWKTFTTTSSFPVADWYKVYALDPDGNPGQACAPLQLLGGGGTAPSISNVTPQTGVSGSTYTPAPTFTGDAATTILWDFGGGATPNTWNDMFPSVTLGAAGSYPSSLTLTNGSGSDTYNFTLTVTPTAATWSTYQVVTTAGTGNYLAFTKVYGKPAFAYINPGFGTIHYVRSNVAAPANSSAWVDMLTDESATRWYDGNISLVEDQYGTPVIFGWDSVSGHAYYLGSNLTEPNNPTDWAISDIGLADEVGSAMLANGTIDLSLKAIDGLHIFEPTAYPPAGPADWTDANIDGTPGAGGNSKIMSNSDDNALYIFHYNYSTQGLFTSRCSYANRLTGGSWTTYLASASLGNEAGLYYDFAFDPAALSNNLFYIYTSNEAVGTVLNDVLGFEGAGDASSFTFSWAASGTGENHGRMCSMAFGGGDVMAAYQGNDSSQLIFNSAPFTTDILPFTWTPQVVPSASSSTVRDTNMLVIGTNVVIVYGRDDGIYYAALPLT